MRGVTYIRPEPENTDRYCACRTPVPARLYLGHWSCACGVLIEKK